MEFGERKRRRKSQSFKLVTDEDSSCVMSSSSSCKDVTRSSSNSAAPDVWVGEEGMEIKRQITGMMRLLSDRSGRVYQRVTTEQDAAAKEPQGRPPPWPQQPPPLPADHQRNSWSSAAEPGPSPSSAPASAPPSSLGCGQQGSKARRVTDTKDLRTARESNDAAPPAEPEAPCCMCNCKGTLQAILREMRAMRRLMVTQKACADKGRQAASAAQPGLGSGQPGHCRPRRRRPAYKVAPHLLPSRRASPAAPEAPPPPPPPLRAAFAGSRQREGCEEQEAPAPASDPHSSRTSAAAPPQHQPVNVDHAANSRLNQNQPLEPEVRLAEDYDIFISKAQLDSILVNYTRSGSLLFRKLVCAFFDDATLANSLPNGKRKRGLNDNRKGLDQNIVGAIKEKYCTEHRIEKLPGPRDWVQILQDQIKLARRRLKRDAAEVEDGLNGPSTSCIKPGAVKESVVNTTG